MLLSNLLARFQGWDPGELVRGIPTLHYGTGNDIPAAVMETVLLSNLLAMVQHIGYRGQRFTTYVGEKKMQEDQHIRNRGQRIN